MNNAEDLNGATFLGFTEYCSQENGEKEPIMLFEKDGQKFTVFVCTDDDDVKGYFHVQSGEIRGSEPQWDILMSSDLSEEEFSYDSEEEAIAAHQRLLLACSENFPNLEREFTLVSPHGEETTLESYEPT